MKRDSTGRNHRTRRVQFSRIVSEAVLAARRTKMLLILAALPYVGSYLALNTGCNTPKVFARFAYVRSDSSPVIA
jgi:hypothetical protein